MEGEPLAKARSVKDALLMSTTPPDLRIAISRISTPRYSPTTSAPRTSADRMHKMPQHSQGLERHHNLAVFHTITYEYQDLLLPHVSS